jgi:phosphatidate cytidylyltransferase
VAVPLLLVLLFLGPAWGWLLFLLGIGVVAAVELFGMTHPNDKVALACGVATIWAVTLGIWFGVDRPLVLLTVLLALPFASVLLALWRLGDIPTAALRLAMSTFGPLWIGAGLGSIALLRLKGGDQGAYFVVLSLALAWLADTGGYFAGRAFGKHKLYEKVSPKKTVEGAFGGVAAAVIAAVVMSLFFLPSMSLRDAVLLGALGGFLGMLGDLGESLLKRSVGVKDSGGIVPGHGGILDRIDAVLVTAPLTLLYLLWVH